MELQGTFEPLAARATQGELVLQTLTRAIVEGWLAPGSLHSVQELATQLHVSRSPVREALIQLARDGVVQFERNRGVRVVATSQRDLEEIFEIREWLEVPATRRAAARAANEDIHALRAHFELMIAAGRTNDEAMLWENDRKFHAVILRAGGNQRLATYVDSMRDLVLRRDATTVGRQRTVMLVAEEHRPILQAVERRDAEGAAAVMQAHLQNTIALLLEVRSGDSSAIGREKA